MYLTNRWLSEVWPVTGTPAIATVVLGGLAAVAALMIQLEVLVEMMSIGKRYVLRYICMRGMHKVYVCEPFLCIPMLFKSKLAYKYELNAKRKCCF
jgi:hypothetical protein